MARQDRASRRHHHPTNLPAGGSSGNPVVDIEATNVDVQPNGLLNCVMLEITDPSGAGFRACLDLDQAIDMALRLTGAAIRLRRILTP